MYKPEMPVKGKQIPGFIAAPETSISTRLSDKLLPMQYLTYLHSKSWFKHAMQSLCDRRKTSNFDLEYKKVANGLNTVSWKEWLPHSDLGETKTVCMEYGP